MSTQSRKTQAGFRSSRDGSFVPTSLDMLGRISLDPQFRSALTNAQCKVVVEIDAGGTNVKIVDQNGNIVSGIADAQKLGGIRGFIQKERKEESSAIAGDELARMSFLLTEKIKKIDNDFKQMPVGSVYVAAAKPLLNTVRNLDRNFSLVEANKNDKHRQLMLDYIESNKNRIKMAYVIHLEHLLKGEAKKGDLSKVLFENAVPESFHSRFTTKNFLCDPGQELCRLLFNSDPSKGLAFTLKEWRDPTFVAKQGSIVSSSTILQNLLADDDLIRFICRLDKSVDLNDESNSVVMGLLKTKLPVIPPMGDPSYVYDVASKQKSSGWRFPAPSMETPKGALVRLGHAVLRLYSANPMLVELVEDFYGVIAPGSINMNQLSVSNNLYAQWKSWSEKPENSNATALWRSIHKGDGDQIAHRRKIASWIAIEIQTSLESVGGKAIRKACGLSESGLSANKLNTTPTSSVKDDDGNPAGAKLQAGDIGPLRPMFKPGPIKYADKFDLFRKLTPEETSILIDYKKRIFPAKTRKELGKVSYGAPLTTLSSAGEKLIKMLIDNQHPYVATSMKSWLRTFSSKRMQVAAALQAIAGFEQFFSDDIDHQENNTALESDSEAEDDETYE